MSKFIAYVYRWYLDDATGNNAYLCYATSDGVPDANAAAVEPFCKPDLDVSGVDGESISISLPNFDNALSALALNYKLQGSRCELSVFEEDESGTETETLIFNGIVNAIPKIDNHLSVHAVAYAGLAHAPNVYVSAPLFNFITPADNVIQFGNITYTIKGGKYD